MTNTVTACNTVNLLDKTTYDQQVRPDTELWAVDEESDSDYKEMVVGWGIPDYTAGVQTAANTDYTTPKNGFVKVTWSVATNDVYINDAKMTSYVMGYNTSFAGGIFIPVKKGDKVKSTANAIVFYPCLGG